MTTKAAGGKITGLLALTCEAQEAIAIRNFVHLVGDYEVEIADGTKPILGAVSVANKHRDPATGAYPANKVPGDVTVEARGFWVGVYTSGAAIEAGELVGTVNGISVVPADTVGASEVGIALTSAVGAGEAVDVLVR